MINRRRKSQLVFLALGLASLVLPQHASAIPNSFQGNGFFGPVIPAMPRFGANLTEDFLDPAKWKAQKFPGPWQKQASLPGETVTRMSANPVVLGAVPDSVVAWGDENSLNKISLTYLDAGTYFGFKFGGEKTHKDRRSGVRKRSEFAHHFIKLERNLRSRLEKGCGKGTQRTVGRSKLLRTVFTDYQWETFVLRLTAREGHSVNVSILRKGDLPGGFLDPSIAGLDKRARRKLLASKVRHNDRGDTLISEIPIYQQGDTPFCGIHSLAMVGQYLGLRLSADALEAGAGLRNTGSAKGSKVLDLYHAAAEELGMRVRVSSSFDSKRVQRSLEAGLPVIAWRRVSKEREKAHSEFAKAFAKDPAASLPVPSSSKRESWPPRNKKGSPSHGSVINGMNSERSEVIFSEPWGEKARNHRMRIEEMEATAYAVFYFEFR